MLYGVAVFWGPEFVRSHAGSIAHELAERSKLSKEELFAAILEPFDLESAEPPPDVETASAAKRTEVRTCNAIWTIAASSRGESSDEIGSRSLPHHPAW